MTTTHDLPVLPAIVEGTVSHHRRGPIDYEFRHRVYQWLVDLDEMPRPPWYLRPVTGFDARDHLGGAGPDASADIKTNVERFIARGGLEPDIGGRIVMLANPRVFGHVFDPLTVFWCFGADGTLRCVVAEVHNTYGERHAYLLTLDPSGKADVDKQFYVSPFNDVSGHYSMRFSLTERTVMVSVSLLRSDQRRVRGRVRGRADAGDRQDDRPVRVPHAGDAAEGVGLDSRARDPTLGPTIADHRPAATHATGRSLMTDTTTRDRSIEPCLGMQAPLENWPGLFTPPRAPMKGAVARRVVRRAVAGLPLRVEFPDGTWIGAGGATDPRMAIHRPAQFFARLGADAKIGFGEAYMVGDWDAGADTDLADLLTPFASNLRTLVPKNLQRLRGLVERRQPATERPNRTQARENIRRHYDLSNELFASFLDETLSYSSALFEDGDDLSSAQRRKITAVLDFARVGPGCTLLEIGTGWGELAIQAARRGAHVTSITLSTEQRDLALRRVAAAGVSDRVRILLADYRDIAGHYDAIVSVEMIEAVGLRYWPVFFATLDRLLRPGGRVGLQSITMQHDRMWATRNSYTWIHKYIFPGGIVPSVDAIERTLRAHTSLAIVDRRDFGADYATTLRCWRQTFLANWPMIAGDRFDPVFRRMWEFYLAYSEAGFRAGYLGVSQFSLTREAAPPSSTPRGARVAGPEPDSRPTD